MWKRSRAQEEKVDQKETRLEEKKNRKRCMKISNDRNEKKSGSGSGSNIFFLLLTDLREPQLQSLSLWRTQQETLNHS